MRDNADMRILGRIQTLSGIYGTAGYINTTYGAASGSHVRVQSHLNHPERNVKTDKFLASVAFTDKPNNNVP